MSGTFLDTNHIDWFGLVGFYDISTIVGNAKSYLYIYIKYIYDLLTHFMTFLDEPELFFAHC